MRWMEDEKPGIRYLLKFSRRAAGKLSEYFDPSQVETLPDGSSVATAFYPDKDWVIRFFLTFGDDLEVIEPAAAREKLREIAGNILKKYSN
jgi:predicted DNA-binding transcriptional regulator YafY